MIQIPVLRFASLLAAVIALLFSSSLFALDGEWTKLGPDRAATAAVAVDPFDDRIMYATALAGYYKTVDRGASWTYHNAQLSNFGAPYDVEVDPNDPDHLLLITSNPGIRESFDGGDTWSFLPSQPIVSNFAQIDPSNLNRIYIARRAGVADKIQVTADGGATWNPAANGLPTGETIQGLGMDPNNHQRLVASLTVSDAEDLGLRTMYYTTDGGANWNPAITGPTYTPSAITYNLTLNSPIFSPADGDRVYAFNGAFVYGSGDGGLNWSEVWFDNDYRVTRLMFDPADGSRLLALASRNAGGLVLLESSTANDTLWTEVGSGFVPYFDQMAFSGNRHYVASSSGVYYSTDDGATWTHASTGMDKANVKDVVVHPSVEGLLYLTSNGFLRSEDGGRNWTLMSQDSGLGELFFDPSDSDIIFAGRGNGISRTVDGGQTWTRLAAPSTSTTQVLINPNDGDDFFYITSGRLYRSRDGGLTDELLLAGSTSVGTVAYDPLNASLIFATVRNSGNGRIELIRSIDGGDSWSGLGALPTPHSGDANPVVATSSYELIINPQNTLEMYLATNAGVWKSIDGGVDWVLSDDTAFPWDIELDLLDPQRVYATTFFSGARISTDAGATWSDMNDSAALQITTPTRIRVSPHNNERIYVATARDGLLVTGDEFVPPASAVSGDGSSGSSAGAGLFLLLAICGLLRRSRARTVAKFPNPALGAR